MILKEKMENKKMNELWYENVSYEDAKDLIKESLANTVSSFVVAGYWLKYIRDKKTYEKEGYSSLWEMAEKEFGLKESEASRAMSMNDKYSVDGNTPVMLEKYMGYNKSQLQEMLTMTEKQLEKATADMKVQELRQLKKTGATSEELEMLREVLVHYARTAYADICKTFMELGGEVSEIIKEKLECDVPVICGNKVFFTGDDKDDKDEMVERITGEVLATYSPDVAVGMILEEYQKLHEVRQIKRKPDIRGLCDDAYCSECGCSLNEPDSGLEVSLICPRCGQAVNWNGYGVKELEELVNTESDGYLEEKSEAEPVATSQEPVNTESDVLLEAEIVEEIEAEEEEIIEHLEFDVLDDEEGEEKEEIIILDGEFREIPVVEEVSAYGLAKTEYPVGSSIATKGCGHKYSCFSCAKECGIRQEGRYCVEAPMGNPFTCTTMNVMELLKEEMGDICQFVNQELAYHTAGSQEPRPCCKSCQVEVCGYRCNRSAHAKISEEDAAGLKDTEMAAVENNELVDIKKILESEQSLLNEYLKIDDLPVFTVKRQKIIVGALANMLCELEEIEEKEVIEQPELGILRNNDQRQEFIADYMKWPVWIEQPLTGEKYYRYEFEDGTAFVVKVYFHKCFDYNLRSVKWEDRYKDDWGAEEYYIVTEGKYFKDCYTNRSAMIEFLKNLQKGEK